MEHREWVREKAEYERTIVELREQRDLETKRVRELDGDLHALRAEIDDVRRVLGASEGETLLAAAERVVRERQNVIDERDAARTWRRVETSDLVTERDRAWADLTAARARITHLEQKPEAGAQKDAREQRALAEALQGDLAAEMEINTTLRGQLATLRAEHEETLRRLASAERENERHRHGATIEGDFVCPDSIALTETKRQLDAVSDVAGFHEREIADLRVKIAEVERRARRAEAELAAERTTHARARARALEAIDERDDLRAKLAEAEERARRAEAETALSRRESATAVEGATRHLVEAQRAATERERSRCAQIAARHGENAIVQEIANPPRLGVEVAGLAAREAQAPSVEPVEARGCVMDGDGYCARHKEYDPACESPYGAPVEVSEPEALRVLQTWCALDPGDRRSMIDEVATYVVGGSVAVEVLDAAPEVLRLYDAARAEVAALTALVATESERAAEAEDYLGEVAAMVGSPGIRPSMVPGEVRAFIGTAKPEAGVVEVDHGRWTVKR